jgi:hypothetical protein
MHSTDESAARTTDLLFRLQVTTTGDSDQDGNTGYTFTSNEATATVTLTTQGLQSGEREWPPLGVVVHGFLRNDASRSLDSSWYA